LWDDPYQAGFDYAEAFARHFGPTHGTGHVSTMELGNEPWHYPASFLNTVIEGMAAGGRAGDPAIDIVPPALQAAFLDPPSAGMKNYIGTRVSETAAESLSALNVHVYFRVHTTDGRRAGTYPENPLFATALEGMGPIYNMLRWRDENMPGVPVQVTEWGWDSQTEFEDCNFDECVSERAQALYGLRGLLILARLGVSRATWFFFANTGNCDTLFCRSGLTNSGNGGWAKKMVYHAFEDLLDRTGHTHFIDALQEDEDGYAYLLGNAEGEATHLVAWRPVDVSDEAATEITVPIAEAPGDAFLLAPLDDQVAPVPTSANGQWTVSITGQPLLVCIGECAAPPVPPIDDAGVPSADAGAASADAGAASEDAGAASEDAGADGEDGGVSSEDAGAANADGGGTAGGCNVDTDCKGDRICDAVTRLCVDPGESDGCDSQAPHSPSSTWPWGTILLLGFCALASRRRRRRA
jgi:MYXO-CTERM domain-containing protein